MRNLALHAGLLISSSLLLTLPSKANEKNLAELENQWSLLNDYCTQCHNIEDWAGSIAFDSYSPEDVAKHRDVFELAVRKLRGNLMPPPGNERPEENQLKDFVSSMESYLDALASDEPGGSYVALHRLNRKEYENSVEDLLGVDIDAADLLPVDTSSDGFDNVANALQVSPTFLEQYMQAARQISISAVASKSAEADIVTYSAPSLMTQYRHVEGLPLGTRGGYSVEHYFPADGEYEFNVEISSQEGSLQRSYPTWWLESKHRFIMTLDDEEVFTEYLGGYEDAEAVDLYQTPAITDIENRFKGIKLQIKAGKHRIGVTFVARTFAESDRIIDHLSPGEGQDNIPVVVAFKTYGPLNTESTSVIPSREKIFTCYPRNNDEAQPCAEKILEGLARQAFRRTVTEDDMRAIMRFYQQGFTEGGFESGVQKGIMSILASTKFLYRAEPLPEDAKPGQIYHISNFELASRLSFFLWSRGPDAELLDLAEAGKLNEPGILKQQLQRMLVDERARNLTNNFAHQWLRLLLFIDSILRSERSVVDLLDAKETYLDERLARHYGINSVRGSQFRRVDLEDAERHGLLGKSGIHLLTSYPNRTSPVLRGAYILENLVGAPPSAPPPGVETNLDIKPGEKATTVRERLENHRAQPSCNQCHGVIDPLGMALEHFNAIGQWRDIDRWAQSAIDARGNLASGQSISRPSELRRALRKNPEQFVQALTEKLMIFSLGRQVEYMDMPVVRNVVRSAKEQNFTFSALIEGIVKSAPFMSKSLPEAEENHDTVTIASQ
jgi:hypothetical protein